MIDFSNVKEFSINGTDVLSVDINNVRVWEKPAAYRGFYIKDRSGSNNTVTFTCGSSAPTFDVYGSTDGTNWSNLGTTTAETTFTATVPANKELYLKASTNAWGASGGQGVSITCSSNYEVGGNTMSLLYGNSFTGNETSFPVTETFGVFYNLFKNSTTLITAENLELPATTIYRYCYAYMFQGCTSLTTAPKKLPALKLMGHCYTGMFYGCTSLTESPEMGMVDFNITTNDYDPCYNMFNGCTSLNYIKCLALTNVTPSRETDNWVRNVAANGTFVKHYANNTWETGEDGIPTGWTVVEYNKNVPMYVENISNGTEQITIKKSNSNAPTITLEVSSDNSTWSTLGNTSTTGLTVNIASGDRLYMRANASTWYSAGNGYNSIISSNDAAVGGNIMSLLYGSNFTGNETAFPNNTSSFYAMFGSNQNTAPNIKDVSGLIMPATTMNEYCYGSMFYYTGITEAPYLPATTLAANCYYRMFYGCTSLITAPSLPATTLAESCYEGMFILCTSLRTPPSLPALRTELACYKQMFLRSGITSAPELPALAVSTEAYQGMFLGCTSLTTAPELPALAVSPYGYYSMFAECTGLTSTPDLPATSPGMYAYYGMFKDCTNLNYVYCLATDISRSNCTTNWLSGVSATGTFVKNYRMNSWTTGVNGIPSGWTVVENNQADPFAVTNGMNITNPVTVTFNTYSNYVQNISYSTDKKTWTLISGSSITIPAGKKYYFRANSNYWYDGNNGCNISFSDAADLSGNILSLFYGSNFDGSQTEFPSYTTYSYQCGNMFANNTHSIRIMGLKLPSTLANYCYNGMFYACSLLENAPELPATTLADYCYNGMFNGCRSLTTAPALPATTLAEGCYQDMFYASGLTTAPTLPATTLAPYCYSEMFEASLLTTAPALPATTLANYCYYRMFASSTRLTTVSLPATTLADYCYNQMFYGCTGLTNAPTLPATTLAPSCYAEMFNGCTNLTTAPTLPASTLAQYCYSNMFYGCTSLTTVSLPATTLAEGCYQSMFKNCTSLVTAPTVQAAMAVSACKYMYQGCTSLTTVSLPSTTLANYCYQGMFNGCTSLVNAPALPATTLADYCYSNMFQGCTGLTSAPTLSATALAPYCYQSMFGNCTSLTTAPALPATTLQTYCYSGMFTGCTNLTSAPTLPATTLASYCYQSMFSSCTSLTTAPALPATTLASYCYRYMFQGCTGLTSAPALPASTLQSYCYANMFEGCTSLTTAPDLNAETTVASCYASMFKNCSNLNYIKCMATTTSNTSSWVSGVAATGTFVKDDNTTWSTGVNGIPSGWTVLNNSDTLPFYVESLEDGNSISINTTGNPNFNVEYSTDGSAWNTYNSAITVDTNEKVYFRAVTNAWYVSSASYKNFASTKTCNISGNSMSLLYGSNFNGQTSLPTNSTQNFCLTMSGLGVVSAEKLKLPAIVLNEDCYKQMFQDCTSLTTPPELPATTLANECYYSMFKGCSSLNTAPSLQTGTLAAVCYGNMFQNCTSLTTPPALPATTLSNNCYNNMFWGCTGLTTAPELPATTLTQSCYADMFHGCTSLTESPILSAATLAVGSYSGMFNGCSNLNTVHCLATDISANMATSGWLQGVASTGTFEKAATMSSWTTGTSGIPTGWTVDNYVGPEVPFYVEDRSGNGSTLTITRVSTPTTFSIDYSTDGTTWTNLGTTGATPLTLSVSANGKVYLRATSTARWSTASARYHTIECSDDFAVGGNILSLYSSSYTSVTSCTNQYQFNSLFYGKTKLVDADKLILPNITMGTYFYYRMFYNCTGLTKTPRKFQATTVPSNAYNQMFYGCSTITKAPEIPQTTGFTANSYTGMFQNCSSLNYIKCMLINGTYTISISNFTNGVAATGTFVKNADAIWNTGIGGIPSGWTTVNG